MKTLSFNTFFRKGITSILFVLLSFGINAQIIEFDLKQESPNPISQAGCVEIQMGTTVKFNTSLSCGPNIEMHYFEEGKPFGPFPDSIYEFVGTPFMQEFTLLGSYIFICDVTTFPASNINGVADICISVVAEPIPALGEWALIILFLSITIIGVVGIKTYSSEAISQLGQRPINNTEVA